MHYYGSSCQIEQNEGRLVNGDGVDLLVKLHAFVYCFELQNTNANSDEDIDVEHNATHQPILLVCIGHPLYETHAYAA